MFESVRPLPPARRAAVVAAALRAARRSLAVLAAAAALACAAPGAPRRSEYAHAALPAPTVRTPRATAPVADAATATASAPAPASPPRAQPSPLRALEPAHCDGVARSGAQFEEQLGQAAELLRPFRTIPPDYRAPSRFPTEPEEAESFFACALAVEPATVEPRLAGVGAVALIDVLERLAAGPARDRYLLDLLARHAAATPTADEATVRHAALAALHAPVDDASAAAAADVALRWLDWLVANQWLVAPNRRACAAEWLNNSGFCNRPGDGWPNTAGNPGCVECALARDAMAAVRRTYELVEASARDPAALQRFHAAIARGAGGAASPCARPSDLDQARGALLRHAFALRAEGLPVVTAPGARCVAVETLTGLLRARTGGAVAAGEYLLELARQSRGADPVRRRGDPAWDRAPEVRFMLQYVRPPLGSSGTTYVLRKVGGLWRVVAEQPAFVS